MKGINAILLKSQILISLLSLVAGQEQDEKDHKAFDPSQGPYEFFKTESSYGDRNNSVGNEGQRMPETVDEHGYVLYCPCMGRFGNQADQFLGALAFAKGLNRTLALPPWITYPSYQLGSSVQIPFKRWFKVKPLQNYHKVIPMEKFMKEIAPHIWKPGKRIGFCFTFRGRNSCGMKDGNPFGPFWDHFNVDFDNHEEHTGLLWNSYEDSEKEEWLRRYSPSKFPVMAFQGAPGEFPSLPRHQWIQKYIKFSKYIKEKAEKFIRDTMHGKSYLAIHLRNGADMINVCKDVDSFTTLFASAQCVKRMSRQKLTYEMCLPSKKEVLDKVYKYVTEYDLRAVFIATDDDPMLGDIKEIFKGKQVTVHVRPYEKESDDPIVDLAIMARADLFIGNCVSTFSAFVRRQRDINKQKTIFFGLENM